MLSTSKAVLVAAVLIGVPAQSSADSLFTFVRYACDVSQGIVVLTYVGAYNEAGERLSASKDPDLLGESNLVGIKPAPPLHENTVRRRCNAGASEEIVVDITAYPSGNVQGECGTHTPLTAQVWIPLADEPISIEFAPSCRSDSLVTTSARFSTNSARWTIEKMQASKFYESVQ